MSVYRLTDAGRDEVDAWFATPVARTPARDELAIKLALAVTVPGIDVGKVVQHQRTATMPRCRTTPASSAPPADATERPR